MNEPIDYSGPVVAQTHLQLLAQMRSSGHADADLALVAHACRHATLASDGLYRGSAKPFICHLVGTASILGHCLADAALIAAGVLHAMPQSRVQRQGPGAHDWRRGFEAFPARVMDLVATYDEHSSALVAGRVVAAAPPEPVELMLLADELDDLLDRGAWCHASAAGADPERGTAPWRIRRAGEELFARAGRARELGHAWLAEAFEYWTRTNACTDWPVAVRTGARTSVAVAGL